MTGSLASVIGFPSGGNPGPRSSRGGDSGEAPETDMGRGSRSDAGRAPGLAQETGCRGLADAKSDRFLPCR
jgi:hypothetical protein